MEGAFNSYRATTFHRATLPLLIIFGISAGLLCFALLRRKSAKAEVFTCTAFVVQRRSVGSKYSHLAPGQ